MRRREDEAQRNKKCKELMGVDTSWLTEDMDPFAEMDWRAV